MAESVLRQVRLFNDGWLFSKGDVPSPLANKHLAGYMFNKAGYARGAARGSYDDSDWAPVKLPHDWSIDGPFSPDNHVNQGFLPRGIAWYRRHFRLDEASKDRTFQICFDGISNHAQVYVNGHLLSRNFCGYTSFTVDITDVVVFGDALNTVAVRVDSNYLEGWWYEGSGIYRNVWLIEADKVRIAQDGIFAKPRKLDNTNWLTEIQTTIENRSDNPYAGRLHCSIVDSTGKILVKNEQNIACSARETSQIKSELKLSDVDLWTLEQPNLYEVRVHLVKDDRFIDSQAVKIGFRTIRFDAQHGFFLNDKHVRIQGTCNHQDHGGLGVAVPESIQRFRIRQLKSMGCNAYRCSHHPPSPELLDICDELGMLVMDENRNFGVSDEHYKQLRSMVIRDRNHPSIILWSICNEESIQGTETARKITETMLAEVRKLDDSRPITAAISGGILNDNSMSDVVDVLSINYQLPQYDAFRAKRPNLPLIASETHCALTTRGQYQTDKEKHRFAAYDQEHAPWGATARATWRALGSREDVAGIFIWTGFEYRGEPSPHEWPSMTSHWGLFDLCGFEKDIVHLHRAWWSKEPVLYLLPHWNWQKNEKQPIRVCAYTNCEEVELFVSGKSLGRKPVDPIEMVEWQVDYTPGELLAVGYRFKEAIARYAIETTGEAVALGLEIHQSSDQTFPADGQAATAITIFATDEKGRRVPTISKNPVTLTITGPGELIAVCNGDPTSSENPKGNTITLFNGLAQAIVRSTSSAGEVIVEARSDKLKAVRLKIITQPAQDNSVPVAKRRYFVSDWQMTQIAAKKPELNIDFDTSDMNTFERIQPSPTGQPLWNAAAGFAQYRVRLNPPKIIQTNGGRLVFTNLLGAAEVYLDRKLVAIKKSDDKKPLSVELSPSTQPRVLSVIIQSNQSPAGIAGPVELLA